MGVEGTVEEIAEKTMNEDKVRTIIMKTTKKKPMPVIAMVIFLGRVEDVAEGERMMVEGNKEQGDVNRRVEVMIQ